MTLNPMSYGEYIIHQAFGNKSRDVLDVSAIPYRTEELIRYLDQTRYPTDRKTQEREFEKQIEKALPDALEKMFAGTAKNQKINIEVKL